MVNQCSLPHPKRLADFAAGDGALLRQALSRWPKAEIVASEIDTNSVRRLRREFPTWNVTLCDFLSPTRRARSPLLNSNVGMVDCILLNPPYSYRGGTRFAVSFLDKEIYCSRAMSFVLTAIQYLSPKGQLIAVLPAGSLESEKDAIAWRMLENRFTIRRCSSVPRGAFEGCFAKCTVVELAPRKRSRSSKKHPAAKPPFIRVALVRGSVPMHQETGTERVLVHTTDLVNSRVELNGHVASCSRPSIIGPSILFPRVGNPSISKVAVYKRNQRIVLSDCVIGVQCESTNDAMKLLTRITTNKDVYKNLYTGTCARYTTISRVRQFLVSLGCRIVSKYD